MKHDWEYKQVKEGFWVICADCGRSDAVYPTEDEAKDRRAYLKRNGTASPALQRLFPKRQW